MFNLILVFSFSSGQTDYQPYSFFIAGHTSGNSGLYRPFKLKFRYIQDRHEIKFGILTGDIVPPNPISQDWDRVDAAIKFLGLPIYFAVGNHDMENRPLFESRYGDTYYHFIYQNDLFIVLDPNLDHWNISMTQLENLEKLIESKHQLVDNIFVFFHQLLWWEKDNRYSGITPNSFAGRATTINFWSQVEPLFHQLTNNVVLCAGDMGAGNWGSDIMFDNYHNITFIASGMGGGTGDNFVVINVDQEKNIQYDLICLNDTNLNCFGALTDYDMSPITTYKIYPNPATKSITVELDETSHATVQIVSLNGQVLYEKQSKNEYKQCIDVSNLNQGVYLIRTTSQVNISTAKLIIQ